MACPNISCEVPQCWQNEIEWLDIKCEPLELDPDIAGSGVIIAYMVNAGFAVLCILLAYWSDSLAEPMLSAFDKKLILNKSGNPRLLPFLSKKSREPRVAAFERFMLALSDQQLVTGLALLISSSILSCTTTGLDFQVATSLAWWSSTIHLVTLYMLRCYFRQHKIAFYFRLTLIITVYGMLAHATVQQFSIDSAGSLRRLPLQCLWTLPEPDIIPASDTSTGGIYSSAVLGALIFFAMVRIFDTYGGNGLLYFAYSLWHHPRHLITEMKKCDSIYREKNTKPVVDAFFSSFEGASFALAYGITSTYSRIWGSSIRAGIPGLGSFGQLLPLLLLVLPCIAAIEAYNEVKVEVNDVDGHQHGESSLKNAEIGYRFYHWRVASFIVVLLLWIFAVLCAGISGYFAATGFLALGDLSLTENSTDFLNPFWVSLSLVGIRYMVWYFGFGWRWAHLRRYMRSHDEQLQASLPIASPGRTSPADLANATTGTIAMNNLSANRSRTSLSREENSQTGAHHTDGTQSLLAANPAEHSTRTSIETSSPPTRLVDEPETIIDIDHPTQSVVLRDQTSDNHTSLERASTTSSSLGASRPVQRQGTAGQIV